MGHANQYVLVGGKFEFSPAVETPKFTHWEIHYEQPDPLSNSLSAQR